MDEADFIDPPDADVLCSICHGVMLCPRTCPEGHQFCLSCITAWLQTSQTCPMRCGSLEEQRLTKLRMAENKIAEMKVRCCHAVASVGAERMTKKKRRQSKAKTARSGARAAGCSWIGLVSDRDKHVKHECGFTEVPCTHWGCKETVPRCQLSEHEAGCEYRQVQCEKCNKHTEHGNMSNHLLGCKMVEISCPHGCGTTMLRGELGKHEKRCEYVVVSCSFSDHGCHVKATRKDIEQHEKEHAMVHAQLAARHAARLQKEVAKLREQLESVSIAESHVVWRIESFAEKANTKKDLYSDEFFLKTGAGVFGLQLILGFRRKANSASHGYVGIFLGAFTRHNFCVSLPWSVHGTKFFVKNGPIQKESTLPPLAIWGGNPVGFPKFLRMDQSESWKWSVDDPVLAKDLSDLSDGQECSLADVVKDDTLTIRAVVRVCKEVQI